LPLAEEEETKCRTEKASSTAAIASISVGEWDDLREDASVFRCRPSAIESVRKCLGQLCTAIRSSALPLADQGLLDLSTRDLPVRLLSIIATSHASCAPETTRKRELAFLRAENYVEQYASEDINVRDICHAAQVSQRTLEYAFVERFGLTPNTFLTAYRLNATRRELHAADPTEVKVADIGNRWGFWHMGQFAASYRNQFGELPSETLRRASA
jgi:AraC-like DNA-binding protein